MQFRQLDARIPVPSLEHLPAMLLQVVTGMSNKEFLELHARPGRIGLSGGITFIDKAICRAERHLDEREHWGAWSHAFLFEGQRPDGQHWVIESDLQVHRKHIQLGVQENRISKYFDEQFYSNLAVLDLGLTEAQIGCLLREGLNLVADRALYSLRELFGTLIALHRPQLRSRQNLLARERSLYCSALVQHLFCTAGLDLVPGVALKNTTPEDIARTALPHVTYVLQREVLHSKLTELKTRLRRRVGAHIRQLRRRRTKPA
ncbi:MAG: hypothetical protein NT154_29435 [Verrucomicrobia bacterium]|nr:hypothetical protein [Verrucomicrobiota bacterium]